MLVEFNRTPKLVELGGFFKYIDIGRNFILVNSSRFSRF